MRVAAVGDNCIDVYAELDTCYPTGNAVDVAIHLRELGVATSLVGFTGDDHYGDWLAQTMAAEGLDLTHFGRLPGPTAIAELGLDGVECLHQRYHEGVQANVRYSPEQIAFAGEHDLVHSAPWSHVDQDLPAIRAGGARISFDYSDRYERPDSLRSLPFVDYAFFSLGARPDLAERVVREAVEKGAGTAVATLGGEGSLGFDGTELKRCPAVPALSVVNTVGAGDSFIAAFLSAALNGRMLSDCLAAGAARAATVVGYFGPWVDAPLRNAAGTRPQA
jgi:fructoselysine 6-kinase